MEEKKKILVVDPEDKELVKTLTALGYKVVRANTAVSAQALVRAGISLVITESLIGPKRNIDAGEWARNICANVSVIIFSMTQHTFARPNLCYLNKLLGFFPLISQIQLVTR